MQGAWGMCEVSLREGPQRPFQTTPPPRGGGKEEGREMAQRADPSSGVQELLLTSWPESCQCVPSSQCGCWDIPGPEPCWYSTVKPRPSLILFTTYDETELIPTPHLRPFASSSNSQKKTLKANMYCCCCSVAYSCLTLCNPMEGSMPDFPVPH